jgi:integrative and conjugative element protein (TIGR02256 family)
MSTVLFTPRAASRLTDLAAQASDGLETGGILLGMDNGLAGPLYVRHCGDPGPAAIRRRSYFRRDLAHADALAADAAAADGSVWIGEWHTHGIALSEPSSRDLRTYRTLLADAQLAFARILAVIVLAGPEGSWTTPVLHAWSFSGSVLRELRIGTLDPAAATTRQGGTS